MICKRSNHISSKFSFVKPLTYLKLGVQSSLENMCTLKLSQTWSSLCWLSGAQLLFFPLFCLPPRNFSQLCRVTEASSAAVCWTKTAAASWARACRNLSHREWINGSNPAQPCIPLQASSPLLGQRDTEPPTLPGRYCR